jgi:hypothetical protein
MEDYLSNRSAEEGGRKMRENGEEMPGVPELV